jgi:hypothetical protein
MISNQPASQKRSLGALRRSSNKTKENFPDAVGTLRFQRHTFEAIAAMFTETADHEVLCNLAAWRNRDRKGGEFITVEISPRYVAKPPEPQKSNLVEFMFGSDQEEVIN